ncbi:receptor-type tyrosine-protein phosphatase eta [Mustelus asterias]
MEPSWRNVLVLLVGNVFLLQSIVTAEFPAKPGKIMVTNVTNTSISLTWDRPEDMNGTQYNFSITYSPDEIGLKIEVVNFTTIPGLLPGTNYTISVMTIIANGTKSEPVVANIFTMPNEVLNVMVVDVGTDFVFLNWTRPPDYKNGYQYMILTEGNPNPTGENGNITVRIENATIKGLTSGTKYDFTITTVTADGTRGDSVRKFSYTKPNPVRNIQIVSVGTNSISLNWGEPIEDRNEYSYMVVTKKSDAPISDTRTTTVTMKNITVEGLISGINYNFAVITLAADGTSADSMTISSYTKPVQIPKENITVNNNGTIDKLIVSWPPPPGNVEKFFVIVQDVITSDQINSTDSTSPVTFTNLRPGRKYSITVITNSGPFNVTSLNVLGITVPSKPGSIHVTAFSTNSISLNWGEPADMDNERYTFNVTYRNDSVTESMTATRNVTTISNLISGTNYTIYVATIGPGQWQSAFVSKIQFTKPNPVNSLQVAQMNTHGIILRWTRPDQYKPEYRFRVLTDGNPAPTGNNGNQTITNETLHVVGLTPGTNYTFTIITLTEDGTEADPVVVSNYTEPVKIPLENISLSNENTTASLTVSWIHPPGRVEDFFIAIEDSQNPAAFMNSTTVSSSTKSVVFSSLRPGRLYLVKVTTISGPHHIMSDPVTQATIPSPPGIIVVTNFNNSTIEFGWPRPENMDIGTYNFTVTYRAAHAANVISRSVEDNKSIIFDLSSGTQYIITVFTTIRENLNSSTVSETLYTQPNPIRNLNTVNSDTTSINLTWDEPLEYKKSYKYRVQTDGNPPSNKTVDTNSATVSGLLPGRKFKFTVFTLANGTEGNSVSLDHCTDAAAVSSLRCEGVDLDPILNVTWTCPSGNFTGFHIEAAKSTGNSILTVNSSTCPSEQKWFSLTNVTFFTNYSVNITTLSCGQPSAPTSIECHSGIARPLHPPGKLRLSVISITHKTVKFTIQKDVFNSNNGPLQSIAVIVTKNQSSTAPDAKALGTAFGTAVSTYVTYVIDLRSITLNTRGEALAAPLSVNIGNNSKIHGYVNQELTPLTSYRFSLAGFTKVKFNGDKISSSESIYSIYDYSEAIVMQQNPDVIVGAVVGTILGIIVIVLLMILLFWWKKRTKAHHKDLTQLPFSSIRVARNAINVEYFEGYFSKQHADSDCGFAEEYEELKSVGILQSTQVAQQPLNKPKNRYNNVLPYDISRVKLSVSADPSSDYINANFMPGYNLNKEFIAAQGPLLNTVSDFWRMIWEHNVPAIVMLTKCVEQGRAKCEQYWPTERPHIYGDKAVTLTSEIVVQDWTIRDFTIVKERSKEKRALRQFHFTGWPDHGVPSTTGVLIEFRNLVRQYIDQYPMSGPTVVHCSAGVGRTGTFISIDQMIYQIDNNRNVDIWGTVHQLRMHRPLMVQTESQYVFLNQCAMEYIKARKQQNDIVIYQNTPSLIYENTSAIQTANGHAL